MTRKPSISVVVPTRNRGDLLRTCLLSLTAQDIDPHNYEILVCDDGSIEDISPVVGEFQPGPPVVKLLRQPAKGPAAARNLGFRSSKADLSICLDSDVLCAPDFLFQISEALDKHPEWVAAEATVLPMGEKSPLFDAPENHGGAYPSGASGYRSDALRLVGGFDETFRYPACEDAEIAARLLKHGTFGYVPEAVVYHPARRVTFSARWRWHKFWPYVMILAKRYRFLAFPGRSVGPLPRLRVATAAIITLPAGRLLESLAWLKRDPAVGAWAFFYGLVDVLCGLRALPEILFSPVPERKNYLPLGDAKAAHRSSQDQGRNRHVTNATRPLGNA
jgi:GT2 family glycosyltransferase